MAAGILAYGGYLPRARLQRAEIAKAHTWFNPGLRGLANGERAMANWDEDSVTMAVEAGRDCLGDIDRRSIAGMYMASTTFPFLDRQNSGSSPKRSISTAPSRPWIWHARNAPAARA